MSSLLSFFAISTRYMHAWVWSQLISTPTVVRGRGVHHVRSKLRGGDRRLRLLRLRGIVVYFFWTGLALSAETW